MSNFNDLVAIPVQDFMSGSKVPVDLYIKLADGKYILIARAGAQAEIDRLRNFQEKDVTHFYIKESDYHYYVKKNLSLSGILLDSSKLNDSQKGSIIGRSTSAVFEEFEKLGVTADSYDHAKQVGTSMVKFINSKPNYSNLLISLDSISGELVKHSVAVSMLSAVVGQALGWQKVETIDKLALGGLLHDIGKKELPPEILSKPRAQMNFEEIEIYESHPTRGMQLLQSLPAVSDDVIAIVYEHHENAIGQGFPRKIRDIKMNPLARVVALANVFCDLILTGSNNATPKSSVDAIHFMEFTMGKPFNKPAFNALKQIINNGTL